MLVARRGRLAFLRHVDAFVADAGVLEVREPLLDQRAAGVVVLLAGHAAELHRDTPQKRCGIVASGARPARSMVMRFISSASSSTCSSSTVSTLRFSITSRPSTMT